MLCFIDILTKAKEGLFIIFKPQINHKFAVAILTALSYFNVNTCSKAFFKDIYNLSIFARVNITSDICYNIISTPLIEICMWLLIMQPYIKPLNYMLSVDVMQLHFCYF